MGLGFDHMWFLGHGRKGAKGLRPTMLSGGGQSHRKLGFCVKVQTKENCL